MLRTEKVRADRVAGSTLLLFVGAWVLTGCNDPQRPEPTSGFEARWTDGQLEFTLQSAAGTPTDFALIATNLQFDAGTEVLRADVALKNHASHAALGPASVLVYGFVPAGVEVLDAACGAPWAPGECAIDYRGVYGDDGSLAPGETSLPVAWRFQVPGGQGFAFRARLADATGGPGTIAGIVFDDVDGDAVRDGGEAGVVNVLVQMRGAAGTESGRTDAQGQYAFTVFEPGIYDLTLELGGGRRSTTALPLHVTIHRQPDGSLSSFTLGDIGIAGVASGPTIRVEGFAFTDSDRDGQHDAGETGIAGIKISGRACPTPGKTLDDDDDDDFETRTDAAGHYVLLLPDCGGPWAIRAASVDRFDRTTPKEVVFVVRPAPGEALQADFGYVPEDVSAGFEVRGVVFRDDDADGIRDLNEPAIAGVQVTADGTECAGPAFASDRTDERGRYELDGQDVACPLPWIVQRAAIPGAEATTPASVQLDAPPPLGRVFVVDFGVRFNP